jgi:hypothetical protein
VPQSDFPCRKISNVFPFMVKLLLTAVLVNTPSATRGNTSPRSHLAAARMINDDASSTARVAAQELPPRSASSGAVRNSLATANHPAPVTSKAPQQVAVGNSHRSTSTSNRENLARQKLADADRTRGGNQAGKRTDRCELGQQGTSQLLPACAESTHDRQFIAPFLGCRCQRRVEHNDPGGQRKKKNELHCTCHLLHDRLQLSQDRGNVNDRQIGKLADQAVDEVRLLG